MLPCILHPRHLDCAAGVGLEVHQNRSGRGTLVSHVRLQHLPLPGHTAAQEHDSLAAITHRHHARLKERGAVTDEVRPPLQHIILKGVLSDLRVVVNRHVVPEASERRVDHHVLIRAEEAPANLDAKEAHEDGIPLRAACSHGLPEDLPDLVRAEPPRDDSGVERRGQRHAVIVNRVAEEHCDQEPGAQAHASKDRELHEELRDPVVRVVRRVQRPPDREGEASRHAEQRLPDEDVHEARAEVVPHLLEARGVLATLPGRWPSKLHCRIAEEAAAMRQHRRHPGAEPHERVRRKPLRNVVLVAQEGVVVDHRLRRDPHATLVHHHVQHGVATGEEAVLAYLQQLRQHGLLRHARAPANLRTAEPQIRRLDRGVAQLLGGLGRQVQLQRSQLSAPVVYRHVQASAHLRQQAADQDRRRQREQLVEHRVGEAEDQ
mmetsp:Transcript_30717/g.78244  ORF Transcript_30717/g.78244 Transcript_30717/m.78244 type:complete len:433 (-) Transcript_30717:2999-4297(-)